MNGMHVPTSQPNSLQSFLSRTHRSLHPSRSALLPLSQGHFEQYNLLLDLRSDYRRIFSWIPQHLFRSPS
ncbi:hypothetical protein KP79_PYT08667 [Mizuhopecten yessoensis]|uniref:Uncharacterized protein n=1 Tax=Mizuhopecten yessoensis TaxID=6573 RepID=A0A210PEP4_MIZYE|nr:hypothetical protein KP79_PYT08667 [Mizuhopecten yessoensis]